MAKLIHTPDAKSFQAEMHTRHTPKFGPNGTTYGTKGERKHRNNHENRRHIASLSAKNEVNILHPMTIRILLQK